MFKWLLPSSADFFAFFEKHSAQAVLAANALQELIVHPEKTLELADRIREIEHTADSITHYCVETLHKTFITPFDREQIHLLISHLDDIVDGIEEVAAKITLYKLAPMTAVALQMSSLLLAVTYEVQNTLKGMRGLRYTPGLRESFLSIDRLEKEADVALRQALSELFDGEHDPIFIIKWKEIYESLESTIDGCKYVANIIEGVILEND